MGFHLIVCKGKKNLPVPTRCHPPTPPHPHPPTTTYTVITHGRLIFCLLIFNQPVLSLSHIVFIAFFVVVMIITPSIVSS